MVYRGPCKPTAQLHNSEHSRALLHPGPLCTQDMPGRSSDFMNLASNAQLPDSCNQHPVRFAQFLEHDRSWGVKCNLRTR